MRYPGVLNASESHQGRQAHGYFGTGTAAEKPKDGGGDALFASKAVAERMITDRSMQHRFASRPDRRSAACVAGPAAVGVADRSTRGPGAASGVRSPGARSTGRVCGPPSPAKLRARHRSPRSFRVPVQGRRPRPSQPAAVRRQPQQGRHFFWTSMIVSTRARRRVRSALCLCKSATSAASGLASAAFGPRLTGVNAPASR